MYLPLFVVCLPSATVRAQTVPPPAPPLPPPQAPANPNAPEMNTRDETAPAFQLHVTLVMVPVEELFRILRNARGVDRFNPLGPVATPGGCVAAVENTAPSPGSPVGTGGARAAGEQYRR